jgi:hypothetical protein
LLTLLVSEFNRLDKMGDMEMDQIKTFKDFMVIKIFYYFVGSWTILKSDFT